MEFLFFALVGMLLNLFFFAKDPYECFGHFEKHPRSFVDKVCAVQASNEDTIEGHYTVTHLWIGMVILLQGIFFYLPCYIWNNFENQKIQNLIERLKNPIYGDLSMHCILYSL